MPKLEETQGVFGRGGTRRARTMRVSSSLAEINVVPLVDVMLVLLVIFMVAAPIMQQGYSVHLPQSTTRQSLNTQPVTVSIPVSVRRDGLVRINNQPVRLDLLAERLRQELTGKTSRDVVLASDDQITMAEFTRVLDQLQGAGVDRIGYATQPPKGRAP